MRLILLPFVAAMTVSNAPDVEMQAPGPTALPTENMSCSGTVPVFNPEGCPQYAVTVDNVRPPIRSGSSPATSDCGDRIEQVREKLAQPMLQRETADPDKPILIAAVDKRVDGCAVLQMHNHINDLRPLPAAPSGPPRLQPAN